RDDAAEQVDIPTEQIDPGKRQIFRSNHHWDQEVSQRRRNRRDEEEKDHDDAVLSEDLVVGGRGKEIALRSQQLETDHQGVNAADEEEESDRAEAKQSDPLVV